MKTTQNTKTKKVKVKRTMQLLNTQAKTKYPSGSSILFSFNGKKDEKPGTWSCCWYNKVGTDPKKNIVSKPPEWQNISYEEALEICAMFDKHICLRMKFV